MIARLRLWLISLLGVLTLGCAGYQLGPTRNPRLSALRDAIQNRQPPVLTWKITSQEITGTLSLQFKSATVNALIQPGGTVAGYNLLYIGTGWALLAGPDQLFTVTF